MLKVWSPDSSINSKFSSSIPDLLNSRRWDPVPVFEQVLQELMLPTNVWKPLTLVSKSWRQADPTWSQIQPEVAVREQLNSRGHWSWVWLWYRNEESHGQEGRWQLVNHDTAIVGVLGSETITTMLIFTSTIPLKTFPKFLRWLGSYIYWHKRRNKRFAFYSKTEFKISIWHHYSLFYQVYLFPFFSLYFACHSGWYSFTDGIKEIKLYFT